MSWSEMMPRARKTTQIGISTLIYGIVAFKTFLSCINISSAIKRVDTGQLTERSWFLWNISTWNWLIVALRISARKKVYWWRLCLCKHINVIRRHAFLGNQHLLRSVGEEITARVAGAFVDRGDVLLSTIFFEDSNILRACIERAARLCKGGGEWLSNDVFNANKGR